MISCAKQGRREIFNHQFRYKDHRVQKLLGSIKIIRKNYNTALTNCWIQKNDMVSILFLLFIALRVDFGSFYTILSEGNKLFISLLPEHLSLFTKKRQCYKSFHWPPLPFLPK